MNSNINDPAAISALLDQLKSSDAWQQLSATTIPPPSTSAAAEPSPANTSVAALLSQLEASPIPAFDPPLDLRETSLDTNVDNPTHHFKDIVSDLKSCTFQQALPILSRLGDDPTLASMIKQMKIDQNNLERQLWSARQLIFDKYQERFRISQTKAKMIGVTVTQHETDRINDAFNKEINRFDREHVLPAWNGLISKQQQRLEQARVPTMFTSTESDVRGCQQQVINVLEQVVES